MSVSEPAPSSPQTRSLTPACVNLASKHNSSKSGLFAKRQKQKDDCCILQSFVNCYWPFCVTLNDTGKNATMVNGTAGANATLEAPACRLFEHALGQMINYQDSLVACQQKFGTNMCEPPSLLSGVFGFLGITNKPPGQPTPKKNPNTPPRTQEPESGGGGSSGMPIWLIILLIVLILVGIGMIILVVRLFREDKDKTKKHPKHSKSTHTKKSSRK